MFAYQQTNLSRSEFSNKLQGLADAILHRFHSAGFTLCPGNMPKFVCNTAADLREDPKNLTRIPRGDNKTEMVASTLPAGDYVLM